METIKSYLETMFANMPDTPEVIRAKSELFGMMEDKYNELISEGKSENEAVGTVISEFGNLDELADTLGLNANSHEDSSKTATPDKRILTLDETRHYIRTCSKRSLLIALGVMLCIISPIFPIIGDMVDILIVENIIISLMFVTIAVAVAMFIFASTFLKDYAYIMKHTCVLDYQASQYVQNEKERMKPIYSICLAIGVLLCIVCVIPPIIMDSFNIGILEDISGALVLAICSAGVMLIVFQANAAASYRRLLSLNGITTTSGTYTNTDTSINSSKDYKNFEYINPTAASVMSVFWPTVSCLYLCISFLTFDWHVTWIIWLVAALIYNVLKSFLCK